MKRLLIAALAVAVVVGLALAYYLYQPPRDAVQQKADISIAVDQLVLEYMVDAQAANLKYLARNGESKIIALSGTVQNKTQSADGRDILILKEPGQDAGFQCLFAIGQPLSAQLEKGQRITVKGVLRAGPGYDEDLDLYENGYLEQCSLLSHE